VADPNDIPDSPDTERLPAVTRAFRVGLAGQRYIDITGIERAIPLTETNGPNERFMISIQDMAGLRNDTRSAYSVGRSLLLVGCSLDGLWHGIRSDHGPAKLFFEGLRRCLKQHNDITSNPPWNGEDTINYYGRFPVLPDGSLSEVDSAQWTALRASLVRGLDGPDNTKRMYSHPSLGVIANDVIPLTKFFYVSAKQYFELEGIEWNRRIPIKAIPDDDAFVIHVDGEEWLPANDNPEFSYRTDFLFAGFHDEGALLIEGTTWKGPAFEVPAAYGHGVDFEKRSGTLRWRNSITQTVNEKRIQMIPPDHEKERIFRVAMGFVLLLAHPRVRALPVANKLKSNGFALSIPVDLSITDAVHAMRKQYGR
jgi:hypothetical protein